MNGRFDWLISEHQSVNPSGNTKDLRFPSCVSKALLRCLLSRENLNSKNQNHEPFGSLTKNCPKLDKNKSIVFRFSVFVVYKSAVSTVQKVTM